MSYSTVVTNVNKLADDIESFTKYYKITYDLQVPSATLGEGSPTEYRQSVDPLFIPTPSFVGYNFDFWGIEYADGSFAKLPASGIPAGTTGDVTLRAVWDLVAIQYPIVYVLSGGTNVAGNPAYHTIVDSDLTLNDPIRTGYTFLGWVLGLQDGSTFQSNIITSGTIGVVFAFARWSTA